MVIIKTKNPSNLKGRFIKGCRSSNLTKALIKGESSSNLRPIICQELFSQTHLHVCQELFCMK
jgi:hypothetical protein